MMPRLAKSVLGSRTLWHVAVAFAGIVVAAAPAASAQTGTVSGRVTDAKTSQPVADALISVEGSNQGTKTRVDGTYRIELSAGQHVIRAIRIGYIPISVSLSVSSSATSSQDFSLIRAPLDLDQVVVTGTRATDRTVLEAPVPIDVLSSAEIRHTGQAETSQIIQMLAPSVNFPRASVNDGTDHVRPATLRGLGPDQTLVLVNGKRRHNTALVHVNQSVGRGSTSVDLNAIPANAIERIEILRDGAAAQYGSDAIAGVINIILKSEAATSLGATAGQVVSSPSGATSYSDGRQIQLNGNFGRAIMGTGFVHLSGEFRQRDSTNRARVDTSTQCIAGDARCSNIPAGTNIYDKDVRQSWSGDSESRDLTLFLNSELPLQSGVKLYGFGGYGTREGLGAGFFRRSRDDRTVRTIYPNGFLPMIRANLKDFSGAVGARGNFMDWNWDLSGLYGGNSFEFNIENTLNTSLGATSPTEFYAGTLRANQAVANLDIGKLYRATPVGPLNVAIGAEARRDAYKLEQGEAASYAVGTSAILDGPNAGKAAPPFTQVFPGFRPVDVADKSRTNVGAYIDLEATPVKQFLIAVAGRAENYSDFGSTTDGKVAARLELAPGLAIRGAAQTGFRAPSLGQSYFSAVSTNFISGVPFEIRTFAVGSTGATLLGAKELKPEQSVNLSGGLTFRQGNNLSFSADYYRLDIDDRIVLSGNFIDVSVRTLLANNGIPGVSGARYFTNAIDTRTHGLDLVLNYGLELGDAGLLRFTGGYNQNNTKVTRVSATPPQLAAVSSALFDRVQRTLIEKGQPKNNIRLTLNHTYGNLTTNLQGSRFGEFTVFQGKPDGTLDQTFGAQWVADLSVSYDFVNRLNLTVGANNLFDSYPDTLISGVQTRGIYLYSGQSPAGFNGRYAYVRATVDFANLQRPFRRTSSDNGKADPADRVTADRRRTPSFGRAVADARTSSTCGDLCAPAITLRQRE